ncbi:hypothetical protein OKW76_12270 [Sphingomonas sp. S1-29]|uniref:hypothetical protein n=1 Tax=Sphingomonas sp. S1-29 TaxID=2991074 RepID=UPI002240D840|nr:hypothetical protein [Sphingomonas sp. S1-29]UZK68808.1 hypothetical protein OKW76_12270 [Sphingomonas sp. S1-29]
MKQYLLLVSIFAVGGCNIHPGACGNMTFQEASPVEVHDVLGLAEKEILRADLIDLAGTKLGDVEGIVPDADGAAAFLLIKVSGILANHYVHVPVEGLKSVGEEYGNSFQTSLTRDQIMALEKVLASWHLQSASR